MAVPQKKLKRKTKVAPEMTVIVYRRDGGTDTVTVSPAHGALVYSGVTYDVHAVRTSKTRSGAKRTVSLAGGRTRGGTWTPAPKNHGDNWFAQFCRAADETGDYDMEIFEGLEPEVGDR